MKKFDLTNPRDVFKAMYQSARKSRTMAQIVADYNHQKPDFRKPYFEADFACGEVIAKGADIQTAVSISSGVHWALHWKQPREEDFNPSVPKWLSERHLNFVMGRTEAESRVWFEHPGIPGVTRPLGETRNEWVN
jgi:hypothetical protein